MDSKEKLIELLKDFLGECSSYKDEYEKLREYKGKNKEQLIDVYCDELLYGISKGYTKYDAENFEKNEAVKAFCKAVELLSGDYSYYRLLSSFFKGEDDKVLVSLKKYAEELFRNSQKIIEETGFMVDEAFFIDRFFEPFKQGFPGFWRALAKILRKYPNQKGIPELCLVVDAYYSCETDEAALELLTETMRNFPDFVLVKELIGYTYYSMKMWNNAIAYLEATEEDGLFFSACDAYFMTGWCYGKLKNHSLEEAHYRKALETEPDNAVVLNNLGYALHLQKKYSEAEVIFERCLALDPSSVYAANNYVRVLLALGKNKDAKAFVKNGNTKISKALLNKTEKTENSDSRKIRKEKTVVEDPTPGEEELFRENAVDLGIKRQQFSNERLLEDELTARIEKGMEVFGKKLKMYKRKGVYGRQFIIPIGRLDLLCEDEKGDLYIIELKKDSGYGDAYMQLSSYLDWFEGNMISRGKKVYGILCLNSPSKELVEKVHGDKRMKLFEYCISYTEL